MGLIAWLIAVIIIMLSVATNALLLCQHIQLPGLAVNSADREIWHFTQYMLTDHSMTTQRPSRSLHSLSAVVGYV